MDDKLYVYAPSIDRLLKSQHVLQRFFAIKDTVGIKTIDRTDYYADDRVGDRSMNQVAPQGVRLQKGIPALPVVIILLVVLGQFLPIIFTFFRHLFT